MKRMFLILLTLCSLVAFVDIAAAAGAKKDAAQKTIAAAGAKKNTAKKTIPVIEFFSYACPHCAKFEDVLEPWIQKLPKDVVVKRIPVSASYPDEFPPLAKLYYALNVLKKFTPQLHEDIFHAIHRDEDHLKLWDKGVLTKWLNSKGLDGAQIVSEMDGFAVDKLIRTADSQAQAYQIQSVPTLVIAGKSTADKGARTFEQVLQVADEMIAKARQR